MNNPWMNSIVIKITVINLLWSACLIAAYNNGWLQSLIETDTTHMCKVIAFVFLVGLFFTYRRAIMVGRYLNKFNTPENPLAILNVISDGSARTNMIASVRSRIVHKVSYVRYIANTLVLLGLIGTVVGFIQALSGISPEEVSEVAEIPSMVSNMLSGMSTALYTTLVGSILNVWLTMQVRVVESGAVSFVTRSITASELRHVS